MHPLTPEAVLDRVASVSYVAAAEPEARAGILSEVAALLARDPATAGRTTVDLPYTAEIMRKERHPAPSTRRREPLCATRATRATRAT